MIAILEYDDHAACERIEAAVRQNPARGEPRERRAQLTPIIRAQEETFMTLAPNLGTV